MSARGREIDARDAAALGAYRDGELRGLARWRFARRLARSPALRREAALLEALGRFAAERDAAEPAPDLWDRIEQRLPAAETRAREAAAERRRGLLAPLLRPLGAAAAVVALAVVAFRVLLPSEAGAPGVVRWIDSGERNVIVLEDEDDLTIIWVFDAPMDAASRGGGRAIS